MCSSSQESGILFIIAGIRNALLESEEHVCPSCGESSMSPDGLVQNKFLRKAVSNFLNETGYTKAKQVPMEPEPAPPSPPAQVTILPSHVTVGPPIRQHFGSRGPRPPRPYHSGYRPRNQIPEQPHSTP